MDPSLMTNSDRARLNEVKLRLRTAGVQLDGLRWQLTNVFFRPLGFEFTSDDAEKIKTAARGSGRMHHHHVDKPGAFDDWRNSGVLSEGYSEVDKPYPIHLDIAINRRGLCRVYVSPHKAKLGRRLGGAQIRSYRESDAYRAVKPRLAELGIDFDEHIDDVLDVGDSPLDGISFMARDTRRLMKCLETVKDHTGQLAFAAGSKLDQNHHWLALSFAATEGMGYRQIWRPKMPSPAVPAQMEPREDWQRRVFSANFGDSVSVQDVSSLHCAVSSEGCNVHVDGQGFVMVAADGTVMLNPNMVRHTLVELVWKTMLKGHLPLWAINRVNFDIPGVPTEFARAGISVDLLQGKTYRLSLRGTCSVFGDFNASGTLTFRKDF
jgi:hypothetical protein